MKDRKFLIGIFFFSWSINVALSQQGKASNKAKPGNATKMSMANKSTTATKVKPKTSQMQRSISGSNQSMKEATSAVSRGPARDPNAPIEVVGQSRNLNMLLILQNPNEEINFVKPRTDYKKEIENMNY